jgi:hypothetical protein
MHRTTINLDEAIYRKVKRIAREKGQSLARTIQELLRSAMAPKKRTPRQPAPLHRRNGPQAGVDISDRDRLYDLMEGR